MQDLSHPHYNACLPKTIPRLPLQGSRILAHVTGLIHQELLLRCEYLAAENQILRAHAPKRLRLTDQERITLATAGQRLGRKLLDQVANLARPDTTLGWYRKLVAKKFDGSKKRPAPGRPRIHAKLEELILRLARENSGWGYDRIVGALANLGYAVYGQTVGNVLKRHGITPAPKRKGGWGWKEFLKA